MKGRVAFIIIIIIIIIIVIIKMLGELQTELMWRRGFMVMVIIAVHHVGTVHLVWIGSGYVAIVVPVRIMLVGHIGRDTLDMRAG